MARLSRFTRDQPIQANQRWGRTGKADSTRRTRITDEPRR
ncbi:hypothetical protein LA76x_1913 [Lysobacter antibioticus]|uniref:Uncharacterized protein n=1 Tax=Lysobacter antibioticus TaxID=84531 RepID=A0A0S2F915_LYSAN|nr:hypothetical protein LA76x_1913 [Lysobacter antibioticus]